MCLTNSGERAGRKKGNKKKAGTNNFPREAPTPFPRPRTTNTPLPQKRRKNACCPSARSHGEGTSASALPKVRVGHASPNASFKSYTVSDPGDSGYPDRGRKDKLYRQGRERSQRRLERHERGGGKGKAIAPDGDGENDTEDEHGNNVY
ncbi:hypothetical protein O1611_g452 [Lasiodiplodia mahajangana]|uniref:Uncharacterized protein n=1 Tax=Lasiodiplodia mahajangana TaxID=1108764 RepID=A0ACC2K072_9PEZI|nr:hypothetical protein O1611_g452 [Lasiodiplodia mahajangana]